MDKIKTYRMVVTENDEDGFSGVDCISVVDDPAIGLGYLKFSKEEPQRLKLEVLNKEKRILTGAIMVPDTPIYRNNPQYGEHYVVFDKETIELIAQKFFKYGFQHHSNINHNDKAVLPEVFFYESYLTNKDRGINPPKGYEDVPDGTWFGTMKVESAKVWDVLKSDDFTGFSIEGYFMYDEPTQVEELTSKEQRRLLNQLRDLLDNQ